MEKVIKFRVKTINGELDMAPLDEKNQSKFDKVIGDLGRKDLIGKNFRIRQEFEKTGFVEVNDEIPYKSIEYYKSKLFSAIETFIFRNEVLVIVGEDKYNNLETILDKFKTKEERETFLNVLKIVV